MTTQNVVLGKLTEPGQILLGGYYFKLAPETSVRRSKAASYAGKVTIGEHTLRDDPYRSHVTWSDPRGGIGLRTMKGEPTTSRIWWSTLDLSYDEHLILQRRARRIAPPNNVGDVSLIWEYEGEMFVAWGAKVFRYLAASNRWHSQNNPLVTLPGIPTDAITFTKVSDGVRYMVVATTAGISWSKNGRAFTNISTTAKYLEEYDGHVWALDAKGQLKKALGPDESFENVALLDLPRGEPTALFQARFSNDYVIYATGNTGLYRYNPDGNRWVRVNRKPYASETGLGTVEWRDDIYYSSGLGITKYNPTGIGGAVVSLAGPDREDGLPYQYRGKIIQLLSGHTHLIALVDSSVIDVPFRMRVGTSFGAPRFGESSGFSSILASTGTAWQCLWESGAYGLTGQIKTGMLAEVGGIYRLFWGIGSSIYWMEQATDFVNPNDIESYEFAPTGVHITPWFDGGDMTSRKIALTLNVETQFVTSTERIRIEVGYDRNEAGWTPLWESSTRPDKIQNGIITIPFPSNDLGKQGREFESIRFRITMNRGADDTRTPDLKRFELSYFRQLAQKYVFSVTLDLSQNHAGMTPKQQRQALVALSEDPGLHEFIYRDATGDDNVRYVNIPQDNSDEMPGETYMGRYEIQLLEI